ncbi:VOC family protein [Luteimonas sp. RIT-PG2_3]|jgi:lactoylglutathione lyase
MKYLHAMIRVHDLDSTSRFFTEGLGLQQTRRIDSEAGRFSLVYFGAPANPEAEIELTLNWPPLDGSPGEDYGNARNFGHLAFEVDDIHATCAHLQSLGITINRPPRDGRMAFVKTPDEISIELLQKGAALTPVEPWLSMPNTGDW